ncbi:MAG: ABC transporter permease [Bifidobacteriaceae bacterium]|jgi:peptide/nickel transport system permease protein|nr:ABC transporter permease [Bifidobacteriaceae bacterium]MCI1915411.1 ABC transporter permease [Bifidobacteriaceae bacterium]
MVKFVVRRLALFCVALVLLSVVVFACLRILPGNVAAVMAGTNSTPERLAALSEQLGLNRSYPAQYFQWCSDLLHGNLGISMLTGRSTMSQALVRAQVTLPLIVLGLLLSLIIGVPLGVLAASKREGGLHSVLRYVSLAAGAVPALWGGLLLIMVFGKGVGFVGILPAQGFPDNGWASPGQALASLVLPALSVGIISGAQMMRYTQSALDGVAESGFVTMSMAAGSTRARALRTTGLRIVLPDLISVTGLSFAQMVTGVLVIENLFSLPGLASMLVTDVGNRDLVKVQSELMLLAAFFLLIGLVTDIAHRIADPRLRTASAVVDAGSGGSSGEVGGAR